MQLCRNCKHPWYKHYSTFGGTTDGCSVIHWIITRRGAMNDDVDGERGSCPCTGFRDT